MLKSFLYNKPIPLLFSQRGKLALALALKNKEIDEETLKNAHKNFNTLCVGGNEFYPTLFVHSPGMADIGMVEWGNRRWVNPKESQLKK